MHTVADVGIPMIAAYEPLLVALFLPIVLIEAWWIARHLNLPFQSLLWPTTKANLVSTLLGVPLTWLVLLVIQAIEGFSGLGSAQMLAPAVMLPAPGMSWLTPLAGLWLCVPFSIASAYIEHTLFRQFLLEHNARRPFRLILQANLLSYIPIAVFWLCAFLYLVYKPRS